MSGFGPAACTLGADLYVSVDDGGLYRLESTAWSFVGRATPRSVHRCVPAGQQVLVLGGAFDGNNSDLIEAVAVTH